MASNGKAGVWLQASKWSTDVGCSCAKEGDRLTQPPGRRATRDDVAHLANVSPATVSNVLNGRQVSQELSSRVYAAIAELEYIPNQAARSLMTRSSRQIGFMMENLRSAQLLDVVQGAQYEALRQGYTLSISLYTQDHLQIILQDYLQRNIEGIICEANAHIDLEDWHRLSSVPIIRLGLLPGDVNLVADYYGGMRQAYQVLYNMGHRDFVHISGLEDTLRDGRYVEERLAAFVDCQAEHGVRAPARIITGTPPYTPNQHDGYRLMQELLARRVPFTTAIMSADLMALGAIQALREAGFTVPGDVSVVSFNNTHLATTSYPALSSMSVPSFHIGCDAVREMLTARGHDPLPPMADVTPQRSQADGHVMLRYPMEFIARQSSAPMLHDGYESSLWRRK